MTTYRAYYQNADGTREHIYRGRPKGNLIGELPLCAPAAKGACGTLDRDDGGDAFEAAIFLTPLGRTIVVCIDKGL